MSLSFMKRNASHIGNVLLSSVSFLLLPTLQHDLTLFFRRLSDPSNEAKGFIKGLGQDREEASSSSSYEWMADRKMQTQHMESTLANGGSHGITSPHVSSGHNGPLLPQSQGRLNAVEFRITVTTSATLGCLLLLSALLWTSWKYDTATLRRQSCCTL